MLKRVKHLRNLLRFARGKREPIIGPVKAVWEVLSVCNARCRTCERWKEKADPTILTTDEGKDLIRQLAEVGVLNLTFTGGEPLLRKDIYEFVAFAKEYGLSTSLYSNGLLLNSRRAKELIDSRLDLIYISLDGSTPALNDDLRGINGYFDLAMKGIESLKSLRNNGHPKIFIAVTITRKNMHDLENMARLVKTGGLDGLSLQLALHAPQIMYRVDEDLALKPGDGTPLQAMINQVLEHYVHFLPMNRDYYQHFADYVEQPGRLNEHLNTIGFATAMINPRGDVYPDLLETDSMGNIRQQTFKEIWFGERASAVRHRIACREYPISLFDSFVSLNFAVERAAATMLNFHRILKPIFNGAQHF
ncbi:MAG: radical SAM protein [candidate division KSB1 bacterium]|nr:radical SAM protein [candidate division KSB1 bacterium]MDZ7312821.1 radical SAM protein [candidate division KSB1 bacterium]